MPTARQQIIALRDANPNITAAQMADAIGCTRQNVSSLLKRMNMVTVGDKLPRCAGGCGKRMKRQNIKPHTYRRICRTCWVASVKAIRPVVGC